MGIVRRRWILTIDKQNSFDKSAPLHLQGEHGSRPPRRLRQASLLHSPPISGGIILSLPCYHYHRLLSVVAPSILLSQSPINFIAARHHDPHAQDPQLHRFHYPLHNQSPPPQPSAPSISFTPTLSIPPTSPASARFCNRDNR